MSTLRYELVFSDAMGSARDVVTVERTPFKGPGGHPVYTDPSGIIRAEISDRGEVRVLASGGHQEPAQSVLARPLPKTDPADPAGPAGPSAGPERF
ncbi:DUF6296 family protein [Streptomyces sp. NPDC002122]|uniref:DUF6296 family protein n=1 Tax=Streptomyces sp. NPDC002122 TaxID=3154407 RepID=UPI00331BE1B8